MRRNIRQIMDQLVFRFVIFPLCRNFGARMVREVGLCGLEEILEEVSLAYAPGDVTAVQVIAAIRQGGETEVGTSIRLRN